jgi:hypothetical protein
MSEEKKILNLKGCAGQISWQGRRLDVCFNFECAGDGNILIDFEDQILSRDNFWLCELYSSNMTEKFELHGAYESWTIKTKSAYLIDCATPWDTIGTRLTARASALSIELEGNNRDVNAKNDDWIAQYLTVGQRGFGQVQSESEVGTLLLRGPTNLEDFTQVSGVIEIRSKPRTYEFNRWVEACDDLVRSTLIVLSLGEGRMIHWSIRQLYLIDGSCRVTLRGRQSTRKPYRPLFPYLHLQPILELAVRAHESGRIKDTGMCVAGEWFLMPFTHLEESFIFRMIALEHLVSVHTKHLNGSGRLPKGAFKKIVLPVLSEALDSVILGLIDLVNDEKLVNDAVEGMKHSLGNLNNPSFPSQVERLLSDYKVSLNGLSEHGIRQLFKIRNQIIHRGLSQDDEKFPLSEYLSILEELLIRVFLSMIDYEGKYNTYYNHIDYRDFPQSNS